MVAVNELKALAGGWWWCVSTNAFITRCCGAAKTLQEATPRIQKHGVDWFLLLRGLACCGQTSGTWKQFNSRRPTAIIDTKYSWASFVKDLGG